jgi:flagellar basal body-associated protein FliL
MRTLITIAIVALLVIGAIALGVKFFNTSVEEQEEEKGKDW